MGSVDDNMMMTPRSFQQVTSSSSYPSQLLAGLDTLRKIPTQCDYTVRAGGLLMHAHRAVLIAGSDYFRALLTGDMRESRESEVMLDGVVETGMQAVIDFIYTSSMTISLNTVEDILSAATYLQVILSFLH